MSPDPTDARPAPATPADLGAELRRRLAAGEDCRAEDYLARHPDLAANESAALELIRQEFVARCELGQGLRPDEFCARFPQWADRLLDRLRQDAAAITTGRTLAESPAPTDLGGPDDRTGRRPRLGRFELLRELGQGGMGVVYEAHDPELNRPVALKVIKSGAGAHPQELARFRREAQALGRLKHPNVVSIYDVGVDRGRPFFVMDYLPGGSLTERKAEFGSDPRAAAALVAKVADGLQAAHARGIIHRDVKPGNVLLDEAGEPRVSDFGLAKLLDADQDLSSPGQFLGTPAYMAPEQAVGGAVSERSDVWAAGVILYELLTGRRPFQGSSRAEVISKVLHQEVPPPRSHCPGLDRGLEAVLLCCLQKAPTERYGSAGDLADDLRRWLRGEPVRAHPDGRVRRAWRFIRRRPLGVAVVLLVLLLGVAAAVGWLQRGADPERLRQEQAERLRQGLAARLAAGEEVVLVPEEGPPPAGYRIVTGAATVMDRPGDLNPAFTFSTTQFAVLELLPTPRRKNYRFSASVQHAGDTAQNTDVGIYVFGGAVGDGDYAWCLLSFNDQGPNIRLGQDEPPTLSALRFDLFRHQVPRTRWKIANALEEKFEPAMSKLPPVMPWRSLAVVVRDEDVGVEWEGKSLGRLTRARLQDLAREGRETRARFDPTTPKDDPEFPVEGGLGLWVCHGRAYFKNVVVTPLK